MIEHEQFFFEFIKNSSVIDIKFSKTAIEDQVIVAVKEGADVKYGRSAVINPNWDDLYQSFINIDFNQDAVDYIKEKVEAGDALELVIGAVKYLLSCNVSTKTVYVVVGDTWETDWANEVIEV